MKTRDEWMHRICADFGNILATMDQEPLSASRALELAKSGAAWLLDDTEEKRLGEAMGLAALLLVMVRETSIENEQKKTEASREPAS